MSLTHFQKEIYEELLQKPSAGLSLPMGSGKTFISLTTALSNPSTKDSPVLVIVSKSLLGNWITEINKFFKDIPIEVIHRDFLKDSINNHVLNPQTKIVLTTSDFVQKAYKDLKIGKEHMHLVYIENNPFDLQEIYYKRSHSPFLKTTTSNPQSLFFSIKFKCLIIDEVQKFTNPLTNKCRSMSAICASRRIALSGTMFDEPTPARVLGYHMLIDHPSFPRTLHLATNFVKSENFKGVRSTLVVRKTNEMYTPNKVIEHYISNKMTADEELLYVCFKELITSIHQMIEYDPSAVNRRKFRAWFLVALCYLRQSLICPIIPLASIAINIADTNKRSELSELLNKELVKHNMTEYLNDPSNLMSSRITKVIENLKKCENEKVIVFTCFRVSLDLTLSQLKKTCQRPVFTLTATMSSKKRSLVLEEFKKSSNGVLFLTYELGAEGLNLQFCSTVMIMDFWWNIQKTRQAIARVLRTGQLSSVNIYYFTSNTALEEMILSKHKYKLIASNDLMDSRIKSQKHTMSMKDIVNFINLSQVTQKLQEITTTTF